VLTEDGHQTAVAEVADVQLHVRPPDTDQRVETVALAPLEPPAKLVGIQLVGVPRVISTAAGGRSHEFG
jgi:hypothetical protein